MENTALKFYRGTIALPADNGSILFNQETNSIYLREEGVWVSYTKGVKDATWKDQVLTITRDNGQQITLNFNDVASASALETLKGRVDGHDDKFTTVEGNVAANAKAISDEVARADAEEKRIVGLVEAEATTARAAEKVNADAIADLTTRVAANEGNITTANDKISALEATVNDTTKGVVANYNATVDLDERLQVVETAIGEDGAFEQRVADLETTADTQGDAIAANLAAIEKLNGNESTEGSVDAKIAALERKIMTGDAAGNVAEAYDTIKEIAEWIDANDTTEGVAAGLSKGVADNAAAIAELETLTGTHTTDIKNVSDALTEYKTSNNAAVEAIDGRVEAVEGKLEGITTVTGAITDAKNEVITSIVGEDTDEATANTVYGAKAFATAAASGVQGNLDELTGTVTGVSNKVSALETNSATKQELADEKSTLENAIALKADKTTVDALDAAYKAADETINERIANLENTVTNNTMVWARWDGTETVE